MRPAPAAVSPNLVPAAQRTTGLPARRLQAANEVGTGLAEAERAELLARSKLAGAIEQAFARSARSRLEAPEEVSAATDTADQAPGHNHEAPAPQPLQTEFSAVAQSEILVLASLEGATAEVATAGSASGVGSALFVVGGSLGVLTLLRSDPVPPTPDLQAVAARSTASITAVRPSSANSPSSGGAANARDGIAASAYVNRDEAGAGLIVELSHAARATELRLTSAADKPERDPKLVRIYGSNALSPEWADGSWSLVSEETAAFTARGQTDSITFSNNLAYRHYKIEFASVRSPDAADAVQVAEIALSFKPDVIDLRYDMAMSASPSPLKNSFQIFQGGKTVAVDQVSVQGQVVSLSVPNLEPGQFTIAYTDPSSGDDPAALQSEARVDAPSFLRGVAADGYIRGGRLYLDDGDGVLEPGIDIDTGILTAADGGFILEGATLASLAEGRTLLLSGGTNTDNGLPNLMTLSAPASAQVINPLTTLAQALIHSGRAGNTAEATEVLAKGLGLTIPAVSIGSFDPLSGTDTGGYSLAAQTVATQVATLMTMASTATQSLAAAQVQQAVLQALATAIDAAADARTASSGAPALDLASGDTLNSLKSAANQLLVGADSGPITLPDKAGEKLKAIADSGSIAELSRSQNLALDSYVPSTPTLKTLLPSMLGEPSCALISFNRNPKDPGSARAGDFIELRLLDPAQSIQYTLTTTDIQNGFAKVAIPDEFLNAADQIRVRIVDTASNASSESLSPTTLADDTTPPVTLSVGGLILAPAKLALQSAANFEIPFMGSVGDLLPLSDVSRWIEGALMSLPDLKWVKKSSNGPVLKSTDSSDFDWGGTYVPADSSSTDTTTDTSSTTDGSSSVPDDFWGEGGGTDSGSSSGGTDSFDWDITPIPDTAPLDPDTPPNASEYRFTGDQTLMPSEEYLYGFSPSDGSFYASFRKPWQIFSEGLGMKAGDRALGGKIDANVGGFLVVEGAIYGDFSITDDIGQFLVIDTKKTKLKVYGDIGVASGSTISGSLGPFTLTGSDIDSPYATSSALRKNTGIEGGITLSFQDFDGTKDGQLALITGAEKLIDNFNKNPWSLVTDTLALSGYLEGRVSTNVDLDFSLGSVLSDPKWAALADMFALSASADLHAPFRVAFDTSNPSVFEQESMAKVHLDNVTVGLSPIISDMSGSIIQTVDQFMSPVYTIENFFSSAIPQPPAPKPISVNWGLPASIETFVNFLINGPQTAFNNIINGFWQALDVNKDGTTTVIEAIESAARYYQQFINVADQLWSTMKAIAPALEASLTASGYGTVFLAIMNSLKAQKEFMNGFFTALDIFKEGLAAIDKIEQLGKLYDQAMTESLQQLANGLIEVPLGGFEWDILAGTFDTTRVDFIDRILTPRADPEPTLTFGQARARLADAFDKSEIGTASTGAGGINEYVYYHAGIDGVTQTNLPALTSILASAQVKSYIASQQTSGPDFAKSGDYNTRMLGKIQQIVNAYNQIQRIVAGDGTSTDTTTLLEAFQSLEVIPLPSGATQLATYKSNYFNDKTEALLSGIMRGQTPDALDTRAELASVWDATVAWSNLNGNRGNPANSNNPTPGTQFLTRQMLASLRLGFNSADNGAGSAYEQINKAIQDYNGDFSNFYSTIKTKTDALNVAWVQALESAPEELPSGEPQTISQQAATKLAEAVKKIADAADGNSAANTLSVGDFSNAGLSGLTLASAKNFATFLDSANLKREHADTQQELQALIDAYGRVIKVADDGKVDAEDFYSAIDLLFPKAAADARSLAAELERLPFLNADGLTRPNGRALTLPFLQSVVVKRVGEDVDTYSELNAIAEVSRKILQLSLADARLWSTADAAKVKQWGTGGTSGDAYKAFDGYAKQYGANFTSTLTQDDLDLIGLTSFSPSTIKTYLTSYNDRYRDVSSNKVIGNLMSGATFESMTKDFQDGKLFNFTAPRKSLNYSDIEQGAASNQDKVAALLGSAGLAGLQSLWLAIRDVGIEFPVLEDPDLLSKIWNNEVIDLVRFTPDLPSIENLELAYTLDLMDFVPGAATIQQFFPLTIPLSGVANFTFVPRISMGADTYMLNQLRDGSTEPWYKLLADSFYLYDKYDVNGTMVDLPELDVELQLLLRAAAGLGSKASVAYVGGQLEGGIGLGLEADLIGTDGDKVRLGQAFEKIFAKPAGIFDVLAFKGQADLLFGAKLEASINTAPSGGYGDMSVLTKTLLQTYSAAADILGWQTKWDWELALDYNPDTRYQGYEISIFSFDTQNPSKTGFFIA
jgi:hypothetical protein